MAYCYKFLGETLDPPIELLTEEQMEAIESHSRLAQQKAEREAAKIEPLPRKRTSQPDRKHV